MAAYRRELTIEEPGRVVLTDLPFKAGEQVKVVIVPARGEKAEQCQELAELFRETQSLPAAQAISEEEIAAEIAAYRAER